MLGARFARGLYFDNRWAALVGIGALVALNRFTMKNQSISTGFSSKSMDSL